MIAAEPELPTCFGHFRIDALIGQGGMGRVYRAFDLELRRKVALKVLRSDGHGSPHAPRSTLLREARAGAALSHPNVVTIYEVDELEGTPFLVMEWLDGAPLRDFVGDAAVPLAERLRWLLEIASALSAAHAVGLVHRDVKPENVIVCADRTTRVLDFGLALRPGDDTGVTTRDAAAPEGQRRIAGTPRYMAPEQLAGAPVTAASDQYAWSVMAYELCAGVHPAVAARAALLEEFTRIGIAPPLHEHNPEVPIAISGVIAQAMDPRPLARLPDMDAIVSMLGPFARPAMAAAPASASRREEVTARDATPKHAPGSAETLPTSRPRGPVSPAHLLAEKHPRSAPLVIASLAVMGFVIGIAVIHAPRHSEVAVASASPAPEPPRTSTPAIAAAAPVPEVSSAPVAAALPGTSALPRVPTPHLAHVAPRSVKPDDGTCPTGMAVNKAGACGRLCGRTSECAAVAICSRGVCLDCPPGWFSGPGNACFQVCGTGGSCDGKAWPGAVCTAWGPERLCVPPGFQ